eukprot:TRINITY_DN14980_c0_g1_i2.p1 TRINITY_DN14980_c0_g1~~TRINITY_DN14980_c0_g1_i2.p1  ORF type:complete len:420 (+),score=104.13 TRINITY_DN14980_c0_g1_i2:37-1260(+)
MMQPEEGVLGPAADSRLQLEPPADCGLKAPTERAPGCCRRAAQGCSAWARSVQRRCRTGLQEQEDTPASCPAGIFRPQEMLAVTLAVIALICLLMALAADPVRPLAAGLAAVLGWLATYSYMLQADCKRLSGFLDSDLSKPGQGASSSPPPALLEAASEGMAAKGFDLNLASGAFGLMQPASAAAAAGSGTGLVQSVLTASLVNEYLRLAASLRVYRERHGPLPASDPASDAAGLGMAEALLASLGAAAAAGQPGSAAQTAAAPLSRPGTAASAGQLTDSQVSKVADLREMPSASAARSPRDISIESPCPAPALLPAAGGGAGSNASEAAEAPSGSGEAAASGIEGTFSYVRQPGQGSASPETGTDPGWWPEQPAPAQDSAKDALSKTIASIEDSINLPAWLRQIRH